MEDSAFTELTSARLVLRRFRSADAGSFAEYRNDPEVARLQGWETPYMIEQARDFVASQHDLGPGRSGTWFQFAIELAARGYLVGDVGLRTTRGDARQAELGFTLSRAYQGHGYAAEAVSCVVSYAFGVLGMHRLFSITDSRNLRAQRLLDRVGFRCEGEFRESTWFRGRWVSERSYAQLESEWQSTDGEAHDA